MPWLVVTIPLEGTPEVDVNPYPTLKYGAWTLPNAQGLETIGVL